MLTKITSGVISPVTWVSSAVLELSGALHLEQDWDVLRARGMSSTIHLCLRIVVSMKDYYPHVQMQKLSLRKVKGPV